MSRARTGALRGAGLVRDCSQRLWSRGSRFVHDARQLLMDTLAGRPDLVGLDPQYWIEPQRAFKRLPGVKWETLLHHAPCIRVPRPNGTRPYLWVHLSPATEALLSRKPLSEALAEWNAREDRAGATPIAEAWCRPRAVLLAEFKARGVGVDYRRYTAAVARGSVAEVHAIPAAGGQARAHALVPPVLLERPTRRLVDAWLDGHLTV
jgi:hypothetical protein